MTAENPSNDGTPAATPPPTPAIQAEAERILGSLAAFEMNPAPAGLPACRVDAAKIHEAAGKLQAAGFDHLVLVTAVDYPAEARMEMVYVFSSFTDARELALVANVDRNDPRITSISDLWETANWHEREVYDLFGIRFENHPDLRRILLEDTWDGHPLRKDYVDRIHGVVKRPGGERPAGEKNP